MVERIRDDDTLERPTSGYVEEPAIIVHRTDDGKFGYIIQPTIVDNLGNKPSLFGILMSDLLDHIAAAYKGISGRDERDIRAQIFKVMRDEDRFKEKDPTRGDQRGKTFLGAKQ
jgi:hypothetical protein